MKQYKQFMKNMPNSSIVYAVEDWAVPNLETDVTVKVTKKLAESNSCSYVIIVCNESVLSLDTKMRYMNSLYPNVNFVESKNPVATIQDLQEKYKTLIRLPARISESVNPVSKMISFAESGDYTEFKKCLPSNLVDVNCKRLMNDVRQSLGHDAIREQIKFDTDSIREQYISKEIFNIGSIVESNGELYQILERGTNYLILVDRIGTTSRKWLQDVTMTEQAELFTDTQFEPTAEVPSEISFKGYTSNNLHKAPGANVAFGKTIKNVGWVDPLSVLNALKSTDEYLGLSPEDILKGGKEDQGTLTDWSTSHTKARESLERCGEFVNHIDYWNMYKNLLDKAVMAIKVISSDDGYDDSDSVDESYNPNTDDKATDKLKVAELVKKLMGIDAQVVNPEAIIDTALKQSINLDKQSMEVFNKMLKLADEVGINYNKNSMKEHVNLAAERAEKYGRRYPNPIDDLWAIKEGKAPSIVIKKGEVGSSASLRPDDEKKLEIMNDPAEAKPLVGSIDSETKKDIENYANTGNITGKKISKGVGQPEFTHIGSSLTKDGDDTLSRMKAKKVMNNEEVEYSDHDVIPDIDDLSDEDIDKMIGKLSDDDYLEAYDDDEFSIVDKDTGEEVKEEKPVNEQALMEVLSKIERMKARLRFAKNRPKIDRLKMIALKKHSDSKKINKRARHMAIVLMKKKLLKGRDLSKLSSDERARIDRIIEKRRPVINRIALKLTTRVRQIEKDRLSHKNFTQSTSN